jgi:hypothetical protein
LGRKFKLRRKKTFFVLGNFILDFRQTIKSKVLDIGEKHHKNGPMIE